MINQKRFLITVFSVVCATTFFTSNAKADCSANEALQLRSCANDTAEACRAQFPTCTEPGQVATIQDTLDIVGARCCRFTGRNASRRTRECFVAEELKLSSMLSRSTRTLKPFIRKNKAAVTKYRRDGCATGSLG